MFPHCTRTSDVPLSEVKGHYHRDKGIIIGAYPFPLEFHAAVWTIDHTLWTLPLVCLQFGLSHLHTTLFTPHNPPPTHSLMILQISPGNVQATPLMGAGHAPKLTFLTVSL